MKPEKPEKIIVRVFHKEGNELPVKTEDHLLLNERIWKATIKTYLSIGVGKVIFQGTLLEHEKIHPPSDKSLPCSTWWAFNTDNENLVVEMVMSVIEQTTGKRPDFACVSTRRESI